jgi:hypothetical protein
VSQQINLFNPIFLKQKKVFTVVPMAEALGLIVLGALAVVYYGNRRVDVIARDAAAVEAQLAQRQTRLATVAGTYVPRQADTALEAQLDQSEIQLKALRDVTAMLERGELGNRQGYADYFRALARQNINGLWLTGVSISGAGLDISVQGRAMSAPLIPTYIARLTTEPVMHGKTFSSLDIGRPAALANEGPAAVATAVPASMPPAATVAAAAPYVEFNLQSVRASDADADQANAKAAKGAR